jgi:hypothetical protein
MHITQKLSYTNRTPGRLLLILEPWAEEYWIDPGQQVNIEVRNGTPGHYLELEHTSEGLTVYGWEGTVVSILRDGKELAPNPAGIRSS